MLAEVPDAIEETTLKAMDELGPETEAYAKRLSRVDTGCMRDSHREQDAEHVGNVFVKEFWCGGQDYINPKSGRPCYYPRYHEWGTSRITPQPMIRPALALFASKIGAAWDKVWSSVWK